MNQHNTFDIFRAAGTTPTVDNQHAMFERMEEIFLRLSAKFPRNPKFQRMLDATRAAKARTPELKAALEADDMVRFSALKSEIREIIGAETAGADVSLEGWGLAANW